MGVFQALEELTGNFVAFILMIVLSILSFFVVVFVVQTGAGLAGYSPSGDFVVLSTAIMVSASILAGIMK